MKYQGLERCLDEIKSHYQGQKLPRAIHRGSKSDL